MFKQLSYDDIIIGQTASMKKYVSAEDVKTFAELLNDNESFHVKEEVAKKFPFEKRICHGMHIASYISELIGKELPGFGTIYCKQTINFIKPLYLNSFIIIKVSVSEKLGGNKIKMFAEVRDIDNNIILNGEAIVKTYK